MGRLAEAAPDVWDAHSDQLQREPQQLGRDLGERVWNLAR